MADHVKRATELFMQGYNCSQAIAGAFADTVDCDEDEMIKLSSAFGAGFSRTRNLCGTVSGMGIILGMKYYSDTAENKKGDIYARMQSLSEKFSEKNGSIICAELLKNVKNITTDSQPDERTEEYYKKRPCLKLVRSAAKILEDHINLCETNEKN